MTTESLMTLENECADLLRGRALVVEAGVELEYSIRALESLARQFERHMGSKKHRTRVLEIYPATLLLGMTAVGSLFYDDGTYWPKLAEAVHLDFNQTLQIEFHEAFIGGLEKFGLSRFHLRLHRVGEILMHAGIPLSGMEGLYRLLAERDRKRGGITASDFCHWLGTISSVDANINGIDVPTWNFLIRGREISEDLVDRLLDVLDTCDSSADVREQAIEALPAILARETRRLFAENKIQQRRGNRQNRQGQSPEIVYLNGLAQVLLPAASVSTDYWRVTAGDDWCDKAVHVPRPGDARRLELVPITSPVAQIEISRTRGNGDATQTWQLNVVDPCTNLMAFDADTHRLIRSHTELPNGEVWLAFPAENQADPTSMLSVDGVLEIEEIADSPIGWRGWTFARCDLRSVRSLKHVSRGERVRVSRIAHPQLANDPTEPHLRTEDDQPVYVRAPRIILPPHETSLSITLARENGDIYPEQIVPPADSEQEYDPWVGLERPILGTWSVIIRSSLGRGRRIRVAIAEGCTVTASPDVRYFEERGALESSALQIAFNGERKCIELDTGQFGASLLLAQGDDRLMAVVSTNRSMWVRLQPIDAISATLYHPVRVDIEDMVSNSLSLNIPRAQSVVFQLRTSESIVQEIRRERDRRGLFSMPLEQFVDTTRKYGSTELWVDWAEGEHFIAEFRPRKLLKSLVLGASRLSVEKVHPSLDIQLEITLSCAPWRPATRVRLEPFIDDIALPDELVARGPLRIVASEYDPWSRSSGSRSATEIDKEENVFEVDQMLDLVPETIDDELLQWARTGSEFPASFEALEFGLVHYPTIASVRKGANPELLYRRFADVTNDFSRGFIETAIAAGWSAETHGRLLAEGFPATVAPDRRPIFSQTWDKSLYLGLLESGNRRQDPALHHQLALYLGEFALLVLREGTDPEAGTGKFDRFVAGYARRPAEQLHDIRAMFLSQGGAYLAPNLRQVRAMDLFAVRNDPRLASLVDNAEEITDAAKQSLLHEFPGAKLDAIVKRGSFRGWQSLPVSSISLAFISRLTAREDAKAALHYSLYRGEYADLATLAPSIVEQDLILAELWICHWENHEYHRPYCR
jgi:hypothetical protein